LLFISRLKIPEDIVISFFIKQRSTLPWAGSINESACFPECHKRRLDKTGIFDASIIGFHSGEYLVNNDLVGFHNSYGYKL
jgi:hypothetical protein